MITSSNDSTQPFAKTICSICYEDLKPIVEDLQAISICGHVFHELCIQQWFEYCSKGKKKCPICKQTCSKSNVCRLYFQSVGDSNDLKISQKSQTHKDPEELQLEFRRLEGKVNGLNSALENRENELKNISNELCACKEQLEKEKTIKNEALEQTHTINRLLNLKTQELNKSDLECIKLKERIMCLARELAAFKLGSPDLELNEDEIVKLIRLGNEAHSKESIDVFKKSLSNCHKHFQELKIKCQTAEKNETLYREELEKTKEKVAKLKDRIKQMDKANEDIGNQVLRDIKKRKSCSSGTLVDTCTPHDKVKRAKGSKDIEDKSNNKDDKTSYILIDDDDDAPKDTFPTEILHETSNGLTNESSFLDLNSQKGDTCFKSFLGSWCKKAQNKGLNTSSLPKLTSGNLIAVGSDGKGGRIKALKSQNLPSFDLKESSFFGKNNKFGAKTSSFQSRGSLQIDHFFSKAG